MELHSRIGDKRLNSGQHTPKLYYLNETTTPLGPSTVGSCQMISTTKVPTIERHLPGNLFNDNPAVANSAKTFQKRCQSFRPRH